MRSWLYSPQKRQCLSWCHWLVCRFSQGWCQRWSGRSSRSLKRGGRRWSFTQAPRCAWAPGGSWRRPRDWWVPDVLGPSFPCRCRRSSSTQEQRYPPPLPLGATAPPTCGRRKSDPGLRVTTQDQEYPLRKLREIRDINLIAGYLYAIYYMNT